MTVKITPEATEEFNKLPRTIKTRVAKVVERLEHWPQVSGAKPLSGILAGQYRIRTGDYRIQFRAKDDHVLIVKIGHRDRFYER